MEMLCPMFTKPEIELIEYCLEQQAYELTLEEIQDMRSILNKLSQFSDKPLTSSKNSANIIV